MVLQFCPPSRPHPKLSWTATIGPHETEFFSYSPDLVSGCYRPNLKWIQVDVVLFNISAEATRSSPPGLDPALLSRSYQQPTNSSRCLVSCLQAVYHSKLELAVVFGCHAVELVYLIRVCKWKLLRFSYMPHRCEWEIRGLKTTSKLLER